MRPSPVCRWFCAPRFFLRASPLRHGRRLFRRRPVRFCGLCRRCTQNDGAHGRHAQRDAVIKAVHGLLLRAHRRVVLSRAAEFLRVGIDQLCILARGGHAEFIVRAQHGRKVAHRDDLAAFFIPPQEYHDVLGRIVRDDPLEALPGEVLFPQRRGFLIQMIQPAHIFLHLCVTVVAQQHPVQLLVLIPFDELGKFLSHEQQFLPGCAII